MVDSVQRTSSTPLPPYQTPTNVLDPNAPKEITRNNDSVHEGNANTQEDGFEAYLEQASITTLEKQQGSNRFDPVKEITAGSVYTQPNDKTQF